MAVHMLAMQPTGGDPSIATSAQEYRNFIAAQIQSLSGIANQEGVAGAADFKISQRGAGANLSVDVATGYAYVRGDDITAQGVYAVWSDGVVNLPGVTVPGAGTFNHRVVLQIQDKLSNGVWSGYQAVPMLLLDTGTGTPTEPNSAITLAVVAVPTGSVSVTNAMINDYRQRVGDIAAEKNADTGRTSTTTMTDDPDLQLLNLAANAHYEVYGNLLYSALQGGGGSSPGDIQWTWRESASTSMKGAAIHLRLSDGTLVPGGFQASDVLAALGQGTGTNVPITIMAEMRTGAAPAFQVIQWAQNVSSATATTMRGFSFLRARRVS